jgi:hypothetical protein
MPGLKKELMNKLIFLYLIFIPSIVLAQNIPTPSQKSGFSAPSSYEELSKYVQMLDESSDLLSVEIIGKTVQERSLYAMKFSSGEFGKDLSKIKVLIFAQQHGNEQSGKEGALLLAEELLKPENKYLFKRIDLAIVPQMNPDGSEVNKRRNGNDMDLNRNHLILTEPETMALHRFFDRFLFEVTMDVHEFFPFGETWKEFGYRTNSSELIGVATNTNVSQKIRDLSKNSYLPFIKKYFDDRNVSNFIYSPGGPPEINYIRHSTFDINDGRQSLGIQNSLSFIQEGMNGTDTYIDNLKQRTVNQMTGMRGLIEYAYLNKKAIKKLVAQERMKLIKGAPGEEVSIQSEHVRNGEKLNLPVFSYFSNRDSVITVVDYRPVVHSIFDVKKPSGYLIPKQLTELVDWIASQTLTTDTYIYTPGDKIEQYMITAIDSIDFEGDTVCNPVFTVNEINSEILFQDYIYIPTSQLKGNLLVIALEPKSMLGLVTYKNYSHLLLAGESFPVLRVIRK